MKSARWISNTAGTLSAANSASPTYSTQYGVPFTVLKPHVVHPLSGAFRQNLKILPPSAGVVGGMKRFTVGCIGARTTAFKTTRFDEIALEKYGITVESFDLSELVFKVGKLADGDDAVAAKQRRLEAYTDCSGVPGTNLATLAKVGVVLDEYIETYHLDALTLRCWNEMETILRVCPCVLLSELNDRGIAASCEIDLCSAITMRAMSLASRAACSGAGTGTMNYGEEEKKVILFHCGPVAQSLMTARGPSPNKHKMFAKGDPGSGWGSNEGRVRPMPVTLSNCQTRDGKLIVYTTEAAIPTTQSRKPIFGCAGVAVIDNLENKLIRLARGGFKHHTSLAPGH